MYSSWQHEVTSYNGVTYNTWRFTKEARERVDQERGEERGKERGRRKGRRGGSGGGSGGGARR